MMEDIRNNLALIGELRVISKTSTEKYRNSELSSKEIARELNVNYLLEGTVQKQGDQVKIHTQLIEAETDDHIWVNTYTEEINDVFKVQSQISESIADELHATIALEEKQRIEKPPTDNPEAYDLYLRASDYYYEGETGKKIAIQYLNQAIELDPGFALAYADLGLIYHEMVWGESYLEESFGDTILYFANKALQIDPELSKGYSLLGYYHLEKGNYEDGIIHAKKAIELDPNNGSAYQVLGVIYNFKEEYIEALRNAKIAKEIFIGDLDYYEYILSLIGQIYMSIYDDEKAASTFKEIKKSNLLLANHRLTWLYITSGNWEKYKILVDERCALDSGADCLGSLRGYYLWTENYELAWEYHQTWKQAKMANKENVYEKGDNMGYMLYGLDKKEEALTYFENYIEECNEAIRLGRWWGKAVAPLDLTGIYAFLGKKEKAIQCLYQFGDNIGYNGNLGWIQNAHIFRNLWEEKEFKTFINRHEKKYASIRAEVDRLEKLGEI
jgi:tetratricopeptide (TPR) repeat protein